MTICVWDGTILATDTGVFSGDVRTDTYHKIQKLDDWIFTMAGELEDYYKLGEQLDGAEALDEIDFGKLSNNSECLIFSRHTPKFYYQGLIKSSIKKETAIGVAGEYAYALLHAGLDSKSVVKQCLKYHSGCYGKVITINPKEYFEW